MGKLPFTFFFFYHIFSYGIAGHSEIPHLISLSVPLHPHLFSSLAASGFPLDETEHGLSLSARLLPLFYGWCFSTLPLVWRARQWTLIPDWAALPSASRCCWESMARLQDPCAHTGENWTNERERERESGRESERERERKRYSRVVPRLSQLLEHCTALNVIEFQSHTLSHKKGGQGRKRKDDGQSVADVGTNVNEERGDLSHVLGSATSQPLSAWCCIFLTAHT